MTAGERFRGKPVLVLSLVLAGWLLLRITTWDAPFAAPVAQPVLAGISSPATDSRRRAWEDASGRSAEEPRQRPSRHGGSGLQHLSMLRGGLDRGVAFSGPVVEPAGRELRTVSQFPRSSQMRPSSEPLPRLLPRAAGSAGGARPAPAGVSLTGGTADQRADRWSADAWLLLRHDTTTPLTASQPSYGRSQAGAVMRYRLAPSSRYNPFAYIRASRAIEGAAESEIAAGLAARPLSGVPVSIAVEVRAFDGPGGREVRPAAFAVSELPPFDLPLGTRGEVYLQGGYVAGDFATAFIDGQARIDRNIANLGHAELRAGAAAWGGAQKDAERLDVGPSAALAFRLGQTHSRVVLDYRLRVAGDAEPSSGPALTISAGF